MKTGDPCAGIVRLIGFDAKVRNDRLGVFITADFSALAEFPETGSHRGLRMHWLDAKQKEREKEFVTRAHGDFRQYRGSA